MIFFFKKCCLFLPRFFFSLKKMDIIVSSVERLIRIVHGYRQELENVLLSDSPSINKSVSIVMVSASLISYFDGEYTVKIFFSNFFGFLT